MRHRLALSICFALLFAGSACSKSSYRVDRCSAPPKDMLPGASSVQGPALRVATINMWGIPVVSQNKGARFRALAQRLNADPTLDAVALQEMWSDKYRKRFLRHVAESFPHQVDFQSEHDGSGLVVVSRLPFTEAARFKPFSDRGKWWKPWTGEWLGRKGMGAVRLQIGEQQVWLVNTHFHACYDDRKRCDGREEYADTRTRQLRELRRWVTMLGEDEPVIIAGDFNVTADSHYAAFLRSAVPLRKSNRDATDIPWLRIPEANAPPWRVDHIWVRPGRTETWEPVVDARTIFTQPIELRAGGIVPLSDHCALAATLRYTPMSDNRTLDAAGSHPPRKRSADLAG